LTTIITLEQFHYQINSIIPLRLSF